MGWGQEHTPPDPIVKAAFELARAVDTFRLFPSERTQTAMWARLDDFGAIANQPA